MAFIRVKLKDSLLLKMIRLTKIRVRSAPYSIFEAFESIEEGGGREAARGATFRLGRDNVHCATQTPHEHANHAKCTETTQYTSE